MGDPGETLAWASMLAAVCTGLTLVVLMRYLDRKYGRPCMVKSWPVGQGHDRRPDGLACERHLDHRGPHRGVDPADGRMWTWTTLLEQVDAASRPVRTLEELEADAGPRPDRICYTCPRTNNWVLIDPTGGDPLLGGPVLIWVCATCEREAY